MYVREARIKELKSTYIRRVRAAALGAYRGFVSLHVAVQAVTSTQVVGEAGTTRAAFAAVHRNRVVGLVVGAPAVRGLYDGEGRIGAEGVAESI